MPIRRLQTAARFIQHFRRHAIGQRVAPKRAERAAPEELLRRHGQAEFNQPAIGGRIAHVDPPAAKCPLVVISRVDPVDRCQPQRDSVPPWAKSEVATVGAGAGCEVEFRQASRTNYRIFPDVVGLAGIDAANQLPQPRRQPRRERGRQRAAQAPIAASHDRGHGPRPLRPLSAADQLGQQLPAVIADRQIAHRRHQQHVQPARPHFVTDRVDPDVVAQVHQRPLEQKKVAVERRQRRSLPAADRNMLDIGIHRGRRGRDRSLIGDAAIGKREIVSGPRHCSECDDSAARRRQQTRRRRCDR